MTFFARHYDQLMQPVERRIGRARDELLLYASGKVLDLGCGSGINFERYRPPAMVVGLDPSSTMLGHARRRRSATSATVHLVQGTAEILPFSTGSFDTVVITLVLCTVADPLAVLTEVRRVLRPGGRLLLLEHVRLDGTLGTLQDWLTPVWRHLADNCHLNRNPAVFLQLAGFSDIVQHPAAFGRLFTTYLARCPQTQSTQASAVGQLGNQSGQ